MNDKNELRIRWAPKVRQHQIRRLYENDARGIVDTTLIDDVGLALFLRCESLLMIWRGEVRCPVCRTRFVCVHSPGASAKVR